VILFPVRKKQSRNLFELPGKKPLIYLDNQDHSGILIDLIMVSQTVSMQFSLSKSILLLFCCLLTSACIPQKTTQIPSQPYTPEPGSSVEPPTPTNTAKVEASIKLAWFYKPPQDGNLELIANEFKFFIMSKGNEDARDKLLAFGAKKPILQYIRFEAIMDPGSCTEIPWQNNAAFKAGDFCTISAQHPDWFLLDQNGERINDPYGGENFVMMDPGNPGWRAFFLERVRETQDADRKWDGVFLDNVEVTMSRRQKDGKIPAAYADEAGYQAAIQGFLQYLAESYFKPSGRLLFANLVARKDETDWAKYITPLDGVMHEGWSIDWPNGYRSAETWEKQLNLAEQTQSMGKFIILVSQGTRDNQDLEKFAFASYLLINQGQAAFRYANSQSYNEAWVYDNYKIDLGAPLGNRYREGSAWQRDFENGTVLVNPQTHEVQINVNN